MKRDGPPIESYTRLFSNNLSKNSGCTCLNTTYRTNFFQNNATQKIKFFPEKKENYFSVKIKLRFV